MFSLEHYGQTLVSVCGEVSERYEFEFIKISYEFYHVHFLVQSIPDISVSQMVITIKSITARKVF